MSVLDELAVNFNKLVERAGVSFDISHSTNTVLREMGRTLLEMARSVAVVEAQTLRTKNSLDLMDRDLRGRYITISDRLSAIERRLIEIDQVLSRVEDAVTKDIVADKVTVEVQPQLGKEHSS